MLFFSNFLNFFSGNDSAASARKRLIVNLGISTLILGNSAGATALEDPTATRQQEITEIQAQLAQLESERVLNAAAVASAPPGESRKTLQDRAAQIKKETDKLITKEKKLLK